MGDIFYNKTVTVYNRSVDGLMETETWYPTVLENVRLLVTKGANVSKSGMESADAARLHVKFELLPDGTKEYLTPKAWKNCTEKEKYFTFTGGVDFFVEGDTSNEPVQETGFYSYMKEKYDNCFLVSNVDVYELIPHLEVGGL